MATGLSATNLVDNWLGMLIGTAFTAPSALYAQLHVSAGDPGAAGTANPSAVTTRLQIHMTLASHQLSLTTPYGVWTATASEILGYVSIWDAATSGHFLWSFPMSATHPWNAGDTFTLNSETFSLGPLAA
ncbi:phage tail fiber protein [Mycolicibacterium brisbanense]|uniref:Uncharacterized protein n=1 Tax=Mycolicibacterium brisbanense TaxID=146020 RepID=A0A100W6Y2_9MYCO|nr:hypothetical protein [Mycolicibacterium brisbanense]MCV7158048.1 hypothetical protein [Mycolicibacterium brisbanense]GAS92698.1 uncharacterized protein RMCB_6794 [Mycolicibacterium brisbanense]